MSTIPPPEGPRPLAEDYILVESPPSLPAYLHLRSASGLSPKTPAQGQPIVDGGSWYMCHILHVPSSTPVAMGRIISDGGWYCLIADVACLPEHRRKGLGEFVMRRILGVIEEKLPEPEKSFVTLFGDRPGRKMYGKLGFVDGMPYTMGMVYRRDEAAREKWTAEGR